MTGRCVMQTETAVAIGWRPGYRPSNGTEGAWFESDWCQNCAREHENHGDDGVVGPGCPVYMSTMAGIYAYPDPGPPEWEAQYGRPGLEARCTLFEQCRPCADEAEADRLKVWPVELGTAWKPARSSRCAGQMSLL